MITRQLLAFLFASLTLLTAADSRGVRRGAVRGNQGDSRRRLNFLSDVANFLFGGWMGKHGDMLTIDEIKNGQDTPLSDEGTATAEYIIKDKDAVSIPEPVLFEPLSFKDRGKMSRIVGGSDASPQEAPWFVMILRFNSDVPQWEFSGCSGVLLSDRHVLTAGHCAKGRDPANDAVYIHAYQPFWGNPGLDFHFSRVQSYSINPNFDNGPNWSDTAIITMKTPLDLDNFETVDLARPSTPVQDGDIVNVYGFGRLSESSTSSVKTLQSVSMPYISGTSCQEYYPSGNVLEDMFCAGDEDGGRDACSGDSGGPLVKQVDGTAVVLGVVSWGEGCGKADKPGVYTSVQYHYDWIRNTVCDDPNVHDSTRLCSDEPSLSLTTALSAVPTSKASDAPSSAPSRTPYLLPSSKPSAAPSSFPFSTSPSTSTSPSSLPSSKPSAAPSSFPFSTSPSTSTSPSSLPSSKPSAAPSSAPSSFPFSTSTSTSAPTFTSTSTLQPSTTSPTRALTLTPTSTPSSSLPPSGDLGRSSSEQAVLDGVADASSSGDGKKGKSGDKKKNGAK
jgi:hypothetical protein